MLTAVGFDDEPRLERNKVDDVRADWRLPPKVKPEAFQFAQLHPQLTSWGVRRLRSARAVSLAKCFSEAVCNSKHGGSGCFRKDVSCALPCATPTRRFAPPSPQGEGKAQRRPNNFSI